MISFENDYLTGAHPAILKRLEETNLTYAPGYGTDAFCDSARAKILAACGLGDEGDVAFIAGGTQTNAVVIASMLKDYEGVVAAQTGHVAVHEAGAIEYTGHKVLTVPGHEGKMYAEELDSYISVFYNDAAHEHMVFPGMVYISHPTEYGTLYTKAELEALSKVCGRYQIPLYLDGARLAYGLAGRGTDVTLEDIARLTDVFYIGGTKCGALIGEAVVFTKGNKPPHFMNAMKKRGALLAKGRLLGIQFDTLFTDGLYSEIGRNGMAATEKLREILSGAGLPYFIDSPTNQQFVVIKDECLSYLKEHGILPEFWEKYDENHTVVRFAACWSTSDEDLDMLKKVLADAPV